MGATIILFFKPYGVLSQFTSEGDWKTLADYGPFPTNVYAAGRLDAESEGLVVLTDDNSVKQCLMEPRFRHPRTYIAQVERVPNHASLERLRRGVVVEKRKTRPARVKLLSEPPLLPPRDAPIRFRKNVPTAWIELTLKEGRNRQIRKMTAAVGHPTLRLVRTRIGALSLGGLSPGDWRLLSDAEAGLLRRKLGIKG